MLLNSVNDQHPAGLGNSSGLLGRNYMVHNSTFFMAVNPARRNQTAWQKTLGLNDWYEAGPDTPTRSATSRCSASCGTDGQGRLALGADVGTQVGHRPSLDIYLTTEDLPRPDNRVTVDGDKIMISWTPNNLPPHRELVKRVSRASARPATHRAHRAHGHRDQLPHVRDCGGGHGPCPQRSQP